MKISLFAVRSFRLGLALACGSLAELSARGQIEQPIEIQCPNNFTLSTCGRNPAQAFFAPGISGTCASNATVECTPPNGSSLSIGVHPVECVAFDTCGNKQACTFLITVAMDQKPPVLDCPTNQVAYTIGNSASVDYELPSVFDDTDHEWQCVPGPGSMFPVGTNVVTCFASDLCGQSNTCSFLVIVKPPKLNLDPSPAGGLLLNWEGDGLDCADDLAGPWLPAGEGSGSSPLRPVGSAKFFKPAGGPDNGIPRETNSEIAYIETGLNMPAMTPGVTLRRSSTDVATMGGQVILADTAGGGLHLNAWSGVIDLPFKFWFYGEPQTKFCVSKHGLFTFSTNVAETPAPYGMAAAPRQLPDTNLPPNSIQCFASAFIPVEPGNHVRAYLYGSAPLRQVWIIWHGHPRVGHGATTTGLVLEETYNRILLVDMEAQNPPFDVDDALNLDDFDPTKPEISIGPPPSAVLAVGIQRDPTRFSQVAASPRVLMVNQSSSQADNDFYLFKPFNVGKHKHGSAVNALTVVDAEAAKRMKASNIPGATVAVTYRGRLIFNKGYGYANVERDLAHPRFLPPSAFSKPSSWA
jgi:hypothetical protein